MYTRLIASVLICSLLSWSIPRPFVTHADSPTVIINELLWMGSSLSASDEWMELRNTTNTEIDLSGWFLTKKSSGAENLMLTLPSGSVISPGGFFLIANYGSDQANSTLNVSPDLVDSDISLVNSALQVKLYDAGSGLIDTADDGTGAPLGGRYESGALWESMERVASIGDGSKKESWRTATSAINIDPGRPELGTPRAPNGNSAPVAEAGSDSEVLVNEIISFDGSESLDGENDPLSFNWSFGDGANGDGPTPTHSYHEAGTYSVVLTVSDGIEVSSDSLVVTVRHTPYIPDESEAPSDADPDDSGSADDVETGRLVINEVFPNPAGRDQDGEFIEIVNLEKKKVSLAGWSLSDGKKSYHFTSGAIISAHGLFLVPYAMSHLLLRNGGGEVRLIDPFGKAVNGVAYPEAREDQSFARTASGDRWEWTIEPTPGSVNEFVQENGDVADEEEESSNTNPDSDPVVQTVSIAELENLAGRTLVQLQGVVVALPGQFSSTTFWVVDEAGLGVEVSSSTKAFPELHLGQEVRFIGRTSDAGIARRVNLQKETLEVLGSGKEQPAAERSLADLSGDAVGSLITVEGLVADRTSTKFSLTDEDGAELVVALKRGTGVKATAIANGQTVQVTGILGASSEQLQLWPRISDDIVVHGTVLGVSSEASESLVNSSGSVSLTEKKNTATWPVGIVLGVMVVAGVVVFLRRRKMLREESEAASLRSQ